MRKLLHTLPARILTLLLLIPSSVPTAQPPAYPRSAVRGAHASRAGAAGQGLDSEALRYACCRTLMPRDGHRHVDHRVARVQRRPGLPIDGAADDLLVAPADDSRVLQSRAAANRSSGCRLDASTTTASSRRADAQRCAIRGAAEARRGAQPESDRHQRIRRLESRRRPDRQRKAAADRRARPQVRAHA